MPIEELKPVAWRWKQKGRTDVHAWHYQVGHPQLSDAQYVTEPVFTHPTPTAADTAYDPTTQPYDGPFRHAAADTPKPLRLDIEMAIGAAVRYANRTIRPATDQPIASCCEGAAAEIVLDALEANGFAIVRTADGPEPVAWRRPHDHGHSGWKYTDSPSARIAWEENGRDVQPLFTHPVPDGPADAVSEEEVEFVFWQLNDSADTFVSREHIKLVLEAAQRARP